MKPCVRCGSTVRDVRGNCVDCRKARDNARYRQKAGLPLEPKTLAKPPGGPLWRFDAADECQDAGKRRALMAAIWDAFVEQEYFPGDEPILDELHMAQMRDMPEPERSAYVKASDAEHLARQKAARHGYR